MNIERGRETYEVQSVCLQALLSQYVALHHEHHSMLSQLLDQLRQYGYQAEYKGPLAMEPMQLLGITKPQQARTPSPHAGFIASLYAIFARRLQGEDRLLRPTPVPCSCMQQQNSTISTCAAIVMPLRHVSAAN